MREPTIEDIDALVGPATPHFAFQLRARVRERISGLPAGHPVRQYGEERMELLDEVTWPKPLEELLEQTFEVFASSQPWVRDFELSPKSVVRDLFERAMTFAEYIAFYQLVRSEGLVLRYLSDAYRAARQTIPDEAKTEELRDLIEWLGELVRQVDERSYVP